MFLPTSFMFSSRRRVVMKDMPEYACEHAVNAWQARDKNEIFLFIGSTLACSHSLHTHRHQIHVYDDESDWFRNHKVSELYIREVHQNQTEPTHNTHQHHSKHKNYYEDFQHCLDPCHCHDKHCLHWSVSMPIQSLKSKGNDSRTSIDTITPSAEV